MIENKIELSSQAVAAEQMRPYLRLWLAVLAVSVADYQHKFFTPAAKAAAKRKSPPDDPDLHERLAAEADSWFSSESSGNGSFLWVCDLFDIDANRFRALLRTRNLQAAMRQAERMVQMPMYAERS